MNSSASQYTTPSGSSREDLLKLYDLISLTNSLELSLVKVIEAALSMPTSPILRNIVSQKMISLSESWKDYETILKSEGYILETGTDPELLHLPL